MPQTKRHLLIVTFFCSVALSSLMVVAATKTCQNIAWLYNYVQVLDQLVDSNLIAIRCTNSAVKFTEYSVMKCGTYF